MSLTWPWALIALLAFPLLLGFRWWTRRRRRRETVRLSERHADPGGPAGPVAVAAPDPALAVRRRPGRARPPARPGRRRPCRCRPNAASILLAIDVSASMCSTDVAAQPADRGPGGGPRVHRGPGGRHPDRPGHVLRHRRPAGRAHHRQGGTARGDRHAAHVPRHRDRPGHPDLGRRDRRDQPGRPADRGRGADRRRRRRGDFQPDTIVVLTDGRNTQGVDPVTAAGRGRGPPPARLHDRLRHRPSPSPMVCTRDQISGDAAVPRRPAGAPAAGSAARPVPGRSTRRR